LTIDYRGYAGRSHEAARRILASPCGGGVGIAIAVPLGEQWREAREDDRHRKSSPGRPPFPSRSGRSRSEEDAGSRDCAYGTYAPPHCGSGSPAPRIPRFAGVREPLDGSHKTLTKLRRPASPAVARPNLDDASRVADRARKRGISSARLGTNCLINVSRRVGLKVEDPARPAALRSNAVPRPNRPGPRRRPAARHDAAPETFPGGRPSTLVLAVLGRWRPEAYDNSRWMQTSGEAVVPSRLPLSPVVSPPPRPSAHANRPGPPMSHTPDAQAHVELPPRVGVMQRPSDTNEQRLRPDASDDALGSPQGLHQVVYQGWVAYFDCHCRCHAPRVAAGEARTSHSRQKRSAVKAAAPARRAPTERSRRWFATRRLLAAPPDTGNPYGRLWDLAFSWTSRRKGFSCRIPP
jgi:hypothetical protein